MITVISGGTGSAKLIRGLDAVVDSEDLTIITNVGDNIWLYGLYICPDIDTILYTLNGSLDEKRGWGLKDDTFDFLRRYGELGEDNWFKVGDNDLATHVFRTKLLGEGQTLSRITSKLARRLGIRQRIIPATDQSLQTIILTAKGEMNLQEYWVRDQGEPIVKGVHYRGIEHVEPCEGVSSSILNSERIIVTSGNPISSIGPTISIPQIAEALKQTDATKVAVSPIVGNSPISGPAGRMMRARGLDVSPVGIARFYSSFLDTLIIDKTDESYSDAIKDLGMKAHLADIIMHTREDEIELAKLLLSV